MSNLSILKVRLAARFRTLLAIVLLWGSAPALFFFAAVSWIRHCYVRPCFKRGPSKRKLRVLVTGGKMTKASAVARACGRDGHTVFTAEISPYRFCHTRYCKYVSKHYVLPRPTVQPAEWEAAIQHIVAEQSVDIIIPCTAPIESSAYAHLGEKLPKDVRIFSFDGKTCDTLDNKYTFNQVLVKAGLPCPETAKMECLDDAVSFFAMNEKKPGDGKRYIIKPAVYDPKARTEILFLPVDDKEKQMEYLKSRNASKEVPYVIQEVLDNPECGCFALFSNGMLTGFEFFESAASLLVYRQCRGKHHDEVRELCSGIGKAMELTGQFTLDLMWTRHGKLVPIECNPRVHSAICMMEGNQLLGVALTQDDHVPVNNDQIIAGELNMFRFWVMDQLFLYLGFWKAKNCVKLGISEMVTGRDALLSGDDPLPFLAMYLFQIPSLLVLELISGTPWLKIDFCIGKIVKEGGD